MTGRKTKKGEKKGPDFERNQGCRGGKTTRKARFDRF